jgi:putative nucleotidyltransferase with HDIG domain
MTTGLLQRFGHHIQSGRLMDLVEDLEKSKIRVTIAPDGFKIEGPQMLLSPELGQLLEGCREELTMVLRMATLAADQYGSTRLYHAVLTEDLPEVQRHLTNGARPDSENRFGVTPFHAAVRLGNKGIIQTLAAAGASFEKPDIDGRTPLHIAVEHGHADVVKFLLLNGAPPNRGDFFGLTPLALAVGRDEKRMGEVLVEFGAEMQDPELGQKERDFYQLVLRMLKGYSDELYQHSLRVADIARCLARDFEITDDDIKSVRIGGLLHDLGKVSLPDDIFDKADDLLTDDEVDLLIGHPEDGAEALDQRFVPNNLSIHPIILSHHEKWDGTGFPDGLAEDEIPFLAQVVGLADYYDHLVTHRPYDPAVTHEQALELLNEQGGHHFSEELIDGLYRVQDLLPHYSGR